MEDKELQELWSANSLSELFAAKRTVEANRRRQEELRKLMAASAAPKSHRLWPVWALSAAASIALLLITLPLLFRSESTESVLVAEAKVPVNVEQTHSNSSPKLGEGDRPQGGGGVCQKPVQPTPPSTLRVSTPSLPGSVGDMACDRSRAYLERVLADAVEESILISEPNPMEKEEPEETLNDTPRIHRRTSTQMVCSNCRINNIPSPSTTLQEFLAASFGTATNTPLTLKTIEF